MSFHKHQNYYQISQNGEKNNAIEWKAKTYLHEKLDSIERSSDGFSSSSGNSSGEKQCSIFGNKCDNGERVI
jgi:hypothetical protein